MQENQEGSENVKQVQKNMMLLKLQFAKMGVSEGYYSFMEQIEQDVGLEDLYKFKIFLVPILNNFLLQEELLKTKR